MTLMHDADAREFREIINGLREEKASLVNQVRGLEVIQLAAAAQGTGPPRPVTDAVTVAFDKLIQGLSALPPTPATKKLVQDTVMALLFKSLTPPPALLQLAERLSGLPDTT